MRLCLLLIFFCLSADILAQPCTTLGQTPETAFPVCGTAIFTQSTVPLCVGGIMPAPGCESIGSPYDIKNPFWYKFTCYQSGTLSFIINPIGQQEDYDWQLFDITGLPPSSVFSNNTLVITGNWSGTYGPTGASSTGLPPPIQCASDPADNKPTFAKSPNIVTGREYLLMVSHFTDNQSGYTLSFAGGTAVITDPTEPHLKEAKAPCDGQILTVKLNKRIKCNSIAANGSDFSINATGVNIISATGIGCNAGFDTDSIRLTLSAPLPPGNYTVTIQTGSDGNTVKDNCDREIPQGENLPVQVFPLFPTPMESVGPVNCAPDSITVFFRKAIRCNTIAANGSDFQITGPSTVSITSAAGSSCTGGISQGIVLKLASPIQRGGTYTVRLVTGTDGNTVLDECDQSSLENSFLTFTVADTVNADFNYAIRYGCQYDTVNFSHNGLNGVNSWNWTFDGQFTSQQQNPVRIYNVFNEKTATLIVSNGVCSDTATRIFLLDNYLNASFTGPDFICPNDPALFLDASEGNIISYNWEFGNGATSTLQNPPVQNYITTNSTYYVPVKLTVTNNLNCTDTFTKVIPVVNNCYIAVPGAFTPNGDGLNDFLYPLNAYKAKNLEFSVFNRFGQRLFHTNNWLIKWDGTFKGQGADPGTYVWFLRYIDSDSGRLIEQKGSSILIRQ